MDARSTTTRPEALAAGAKYYFTGQPCKHGHVEPRKTVNGTCVGCVNMKNQTEAYRLRAAEYEASHAVQTRRRQRNQDPDKIQARKESRERWNKQHLKGYHKRRMETDPSYRIKALLRSRMGSARRRNGVSGTTIKDLGCTIAFFKSYIEGLPTWDPSWAWADAGTSFHLDHIEPLGLFDLQDPEQFRVAAHYTNYQALSTTAHREKTNRDIARINAHRAQFVA